MYFMKIQNSLVAFPGGGFYVLPLFSELLSVVGFQGAIGKLFENGDMGYWKGHSERAVGKTKKWKVLS